MKVVMACREVYPFHYAHSGSPKYIYYLSKYLVKQGLDVEIVTSSVNKDKKRTEVFDGIRYTLLPPRTNRRLPAFWQQLFNINVARYLSGKSFDVLHGYDVVPYAYLHLKNRVPVLYQPFGNEGLLTQKIVRRNMIKKMYVRILAQPMWRYCGTHAELVVAEGDFQIEEMIELYRVSRENVSILPVGIDLPFIQEKLKARTISREQLGLSDNDFVLLTANTLNTVKGINYLVDAFYLLTKNLGNVKLIIIGRGPEEQRIIDQIRRYDLSASVRHLKDVSEDSLYDYFALSDLYVSPTLQRDFIMGILEAEACGLPIVSTGQEWLIKEGINGYVVPQKDPQAMAEAIFKVYNSDRKAMGIASREIAKDYDFEAIAKRAIELYQILAD